MTGDLLDLIYPPGLYCVSCGKITDPSRTYGLCNECMSAANWITDHHCRKCGRPLSDTNPEQLCFSCLSRETGSYPHSFDKGHACAGYGAVEQSVIFAFKYGCKSYIGDVLGEILADRMLAEYEPDELAGMYDMVIPVPIYIDKKRRRGFNHAGLMAESFARRTGLKYEPNLIVRTRETLPMKGLGPGERKTNIEGAFKIRKRSAATISGVRILLIDDIYTTGSTIDEIASLLKAPIKVYRANPATYISKRSDDTTYAEMGKGDICCISEAAQSKRGQGHRQMSKASTPESDIAFIPGAAVVDFLAFAAAGDILVS